MEAIKNLNSILESLLFTSGKPTKAKEFAKILNIEEKIITEKLEELVEQRKNSGIILLKNGSEYQLATNSENSTYVKNFLNAELREKLTDATVEVLAIIAYRQPISKAEIEAIRGVNSQYSIRNLLIRGLIEKTTNPQDARSVVYQTTTEFLMHMGLSSVKDLPEFEKLTEKIKLPQIPSLNPAQQQSESTNESQEQSPELNEKNEAEESKENEIEEVEVEDEDDDEDDYEDDDENE